MLERKPEEFRRSREISCLPGITRTRVLKSPNTGMATGRQMVVDPNRNDEVNVKHRRVGAESSNAKGAAQGENARRIAAERGSPLQETQNKQQWIDRITAFHLILGSIISSVSCVMCNKKVMSVFPIPLTLTTCHFAITTVVGLFKKAASSASALPQSGYSDHLKFGPPQIGLAGGVAIGVMNLSLGTVVY